MHKSNFAYLIMSLFLIVFIACKKDPPTDACARVTVSVSATVVNTSNMGLSDGSITATATGGSGFAYRINGGSYQSSGTFTGLAKGSYTIDAISSAGCQGNAQFNIAETNLCASVNITLTATTTTSNPCGAASGSISIVAVGSSGYTYSLNGAAPQAESIFNNLAAGSYNIEVKDSKGCKSTSTAAVAAATQGPLFSAAKAVIQNKCVGCHGGANPAANKDWSMDCNVVAGKDRIKAQAVDQGTMPPSGPLSQDDKNKITAWINAGGKYTD